MHRRCRPVPRQGDSASPLRLSFSLADQDLVKGSGLGATLGKETVVDGCFWTHGTRPSEAEFFQALSGCCKNHPDRPHPRGES